MIDMQKHKALFDQLMENAEGDRKEQLLSLKEDILASNEELQSLRAEVNSLREKLDNSSKLHFDGRLLWIRDGEERKGPFCQRCHDMNGKLIYLQKAVDVRDGSGLRCFECGRFYPRPLTRGER